MALGKYKSFSARLIEAMIKNGHSASRSPSGICVQTLAKIADASEQICRRYLRGEAVPDYERVLNIAKELNISPGWLLYGEDNAVSQTTKIDEHILHYVLKKSFPFYKASDDSTEDYADFVIDLIRNVSKIDTSPENIQKIIDLAIDSISVYKEKRNKKAM